MTFKEKSKRFIVFFIMSSITFGLYVVWWQIMLTEERNQLLREIRDAQAGGSAEDRTSLGSDQFPLHA